MKILVTGSNGQLGSEIKALAPQYPQIRFIFTDVAELDITQKVDVERCLAANSVDVIINCAAFTAVDKAENDAETALKLNAIAVRNLAEGGKVYGCKLIQVSTDYVFDGSAHQPLTEQVAVSPLGVYGQTKYEGEQFALNAGIEVLVIRTSWLYSTFGGNFVKTMMRLGSERQELGVIFDQIGTPTYARDLAKVILDICVSGKSWHGQLYHYSNEGVASWYDFAKAIMEMAQIPCHVKPILTSEYPTPAQRPHYSVLSKSKIKNDFEIEIPHWRDSLKMCIDQLI
jgi:dTDP-4-dehydrorhamnose reductase